MGGTANLRGILGRDREIERVQPVRMIVDERIDHLPGEIAIVADALEQARLVERRVGVRRGRRQHAVRSFFDDRKERRRIDRLRQVAVHIVREAALSIARHGVRGHSDDACPGAADPLTPANFGGGFEPAHHRHLQVH